MSRTIGSPSRIIRHPSLLCSSADNFASTPSPSSLTLPSFPLSLLSFALFTFSYPPLSLLTVTPIPQGPPLPSLCSLPHWVVVLDGSIITSLASIPKKSLPPTHSFGQMDSWLPKQRWSFWPSQPPGVHSSIWLTYLGMFVDTYVCGSKKTEAFVALNMKNAPLFIPEMYFS